MNRPVAVEVKVGAALLLLVTLSCGCDDPSSQRHRLRDNVDAVKDGRLVPRRGRDYPEEPGKRALLRWASECRQKGLSHDPLFAREGQLVISWAADRNGELLRLHFDADSYRGWEIGANGRTMADCVVNRARAGKVLWSRRGVAPLRFSSVEASSQPAPGDEASRPEDAAQKRSESGDGGEEQQR